MDICHLRNAELEPKFQKYKAQAVLRGDIVEDDSRTHAVFTEEGLYACQVIAAKVMEVIERLPDCDAQACDAVSAYTLEDYWNFDGDRDLSDTWTGSTIYISFTRFTIWSETSPDGRTWSGERLTRKQTTSRPDNVWPDVWKLVSDVQIVQRSESGLSRN